ncbi:MAG: sulfotransferase [Parvularcula sp.]|jgi:hypothetical protein|nr:sulfotransferase [Parvularcula sp.]
MAIPNKMLFVVGAPKCGTTTLVDWLNQNPRISAASNKEPGYFRSRSTRRWLDSRKTMPTGNAPHPWRSNLDAYLALFGPLQPDTWALDGSTDYLSDPESANLIAQFRGNLPTKIIVMVRDPVDRAFSQYRHLLYSGLEHLSFYDSLLLEEQRRKEGLQRLFDHTVRSRFADGIERFATNFGTDLLVLSIVELRDPEAALKRVYAFMGEEAHLPTDLKAKNVSVERGVPGLGQRARRATHLLKRSIIGLPAVPAIRFYHQQRFGRYDTLDEQAIDYMIEQLGDDMRRCKANPIIPTDDWWSLARMEGRVSE